MKNTSFIKTKEKHFNTLKKFVPIVNRVHSKNHIEFEEVVKTFKIIESKLDANNTENLNNEFKILREVTNNYTIPEGVCESYEAVYNMLKDLDQSYNSKGK